MEKYYSKIQGERIFLSPIHVDDIPIYTKWVNDLAISDNIGISWDLISMEKEKAILEDMAKNGYNFSIIRNEDKQLLGNITLLDIKQIYRNAQCGLFIGEAENRSKGYGTDALHLLLGFAFNTLNLNNVMLKVFSFNKSAQRCYEKVGFKEIGKRRQAYFVNGAYHDEIFMDILAEEYKK